MRTLALLSMLVAICGGQARDSKGQIGSVAAQVATPRSVSAPDCRTGTVTLSGGNWNTPDGMVPAAEGTMQEIPIMTGLNGNQRYWHVLVGESTKFAGTGITAAKVSIGRPGAGTNDELLPQTGFMQSSGNAWFAFDRPQPPVIGASNTYSLVLAIRTTGGSVSGLTAAAAYFEVCGYAVQ
jgi:hypothetical protein